MDSIPKRVQGDGITDMDGALIDSQRITEAIQVDEWLARWKGWGCYKRVRAFTALDTERIYQESLHKKTGQDPISIPGELILMYTYLAKAFAAYGETFGDPGEKPTMDVIRKITAIGLRALENYGCPLRDIEGSLAARPVEHRARLLDVPEDRLLDVPEIASERLVPADQVEEKDGLLQKKNIEPTITNSEEAAKHIWEKKYGVPKDNVEPNQGC